MSSHQPFILRALEGEVLDPVVEGFAAIDAWHDATTDLELHDWLGMTEDEYKLFAEKPESIRAILAARKHGVDLITLLRPAGQGIRLAARGATPQELGELRQWLISTGRLR
jgi:hypothetical protein